MQWYKTNGFQPRALATTDILTGLTSGMIDGLPAPPAAANAFQWFRQTKFMLDVGIAPVVGAVPRLTGLEIPSRHLGLQQASELKGLQDFISHAAELAS